MGRGRSFEATGLTKRDRIVMGSWRFGLLCHPRARCLTGADERAMLWASRRLRHVPQKDVSLSQLRAGNGSTIRRTAVFVDWPSEDAIDVP